MSDSELKEYLKVVLTHLRLVKLLSSNPSPQDVLKLQDIDWLIQETEERILDAEKNEDCDCSEGDSN